MISTVQAPTKQPLEEANQKLPHFVHVKNQTQRVRVHTLAATERGSDSLSAFAKPSGSGTQSETDFGLLWAFDSATDWDFVIDWDSAKESGWGSAIASG